MTNDQNRNRLPSDVQHAFLEILRDTLLRIRGSQRSEVSFSLSDHAHNIPDLIASYSPDIFRYYWECERPAFIAKMQRLGEPVGYFQMYWEVLQKHYESLE